ncbi:hypothetical protein FACUT_13173 [Fusarium acutatum]|uniref:HNH nuclease domain-containing protein n=1 Tax=Fusarium acutatum TaxID=78861 RepID=A0A8H4N8Y5_9HYPO|nr:hypothetical protein FACUT_13173 [Fusarium acutatum]
MSYHFAIQRILEQSDGFDFDLALISCGIVTGNTWKTGWLVTSDDLEQFVWVERPDDNILRSRTYYYFVGDYEPIYKYPIVPSFHHWQFPHGELPDLWADIDILPDAESQTTQRDEAVLSRDATCRITACKGAREVAHLVPAGELYWFGQNQMRQYCLNQLSKSGRIRDDNLFQQQIRGKMKLFDTYSRSQSRSASPKKRSHDESAHEEVSAWNLDHDCENWNDLVYSDSPPRRRRQKRSWDAQAQESPPGLAASSTSPRRTPASPRSIQLPESACQREPYLAGSQGLQEINAKGFDKERPAKRGQTEIEWQVNS